MVIFVLLLLFNNKKKHLIIVFLFECIFFPFKKIIISIISKNSLKLYSYMVYTVAMCVCVQL